MKIHEYATRGDCDVIRHELNSGVHVDSRDEQDFTPLAYAASSPSASEEMLRLLIESGAEVDAAVENSKRRPADLAACSGSLPKLRCLLDAGAYVNFVAP